jgi:hypothetical protein
VKKRLICFSIYSHDAVRTLYEQRLAQSQAYKDGKLSRWPYCEAYIPTELSLRGFKLMELSELGSTDHYDWRPAVVETDLGDFRDHTFVHPVLDQRRYVHSTLRNSWSTTDVLDPRSDVMRRLRRVPFRVYVWPLAAALRGRVGESVRMRLSRTLARLSRRGAPGRAVSRGD